MDRASIRAGLVPTGAVHSKRVVADVFAGKVLLPLLSRIVHAQAGLVDG